MECNTVCPSSLYLYSCLFCSISRNGSTSKVILLLSFFIYIILHSTIRFLLSVHPHPFVKIYPTSPFGTDSLNENSSLNFSFSHSVHVWGRRTLWTLFPPTSSVFLLVCTSGLHPCSDGHGPCFSSGHTELFLLFLLTSFYSSLSVGPGVWYIPKKPVSFLKSKMRFFLTFGNFLKLVFSF